MPDIVYVLDCWQLFPHILSKLLVPISNQFFYFQVGLLHGFHHTLETFELHCIAVLHFSALKRSNIHETVVTVLFIATFTC